MYQLLLSCTLSSSLSSMTSAYLIRLRMYDVSLRFDRSLCGEANPLMSSMSAVILITPEVIDP